MLTELLLASHYDLRVAHIFWKDHKLNQWWRERRPQHYYYEWWYQWPKKRKIWRISVKAQSEYQTVSKAYSARRNQGKELFCGKKRSWIKHWWTTASKDRVWEKALRELHPTWVVRDLLARRMLRTNGVSYPGPNFWKYFLLTVSMDPGLNKLVINVHVGNNNTWGKQVCFPVY